MAKKIWELEIAYFVLGKGRFHALGQETLNLCYPGPLRCERASPKSPSLVPRYEEGQPLVSSFAV